jgi:hypothetical protein
MGSELSFKVEIHARKVHLCVAWSLKLPGLNFLLLNPIKSSVLAGHQQLTPVIPATQEAEVRKIMVRS